MTVPIDKLGSAIADPGKPMVAKGAALGILGIILLLLGFFTGCAARHPAPVLELTDPVITTETVWRGVVRITGMAVVKKTGRLTILPGTRIVFTPQDQNGDGIGDSHLLVEGAIVARGSAEAPILFTSGAAQPKPSDWTFLYLDFAREGVLEHIIAEYAFSGIQVHFCKARISDSIFRYNVDGVRFSTANIELTRSRIHDNTHGLRYEERRGTARIHGNDIRDNEIGIFVVTRAEDRTRIEGNNITGSGKYQVKMGLNQPGDVSFPRNWWGSADPEVIEAGFFDQSFDPALGRVRAPEPLAGPLPLLEGRETSK